MTQKSELKEAVKKAVIKVNVITVGVDKVFPNTWNPNKQTDFTFEKERKSIRKFGFVDPVLVREIPEGFEIIDGEHRWRGGQLEGLDQIPVNNLGKVSDSVAKQLTIIMNETRGRADRVDLSKLMRELEQEIGRDDLADVMPFVDAEMDAFLNENAIDWKNLGTSKPSSSGPGDSGEFKTVAYRLPEGVAEQLEAQVTRFKKALNPDDDPEDVSPVLAIEAMVQHLAQLPDDQLIG